MSHQIILKGFRWCNNDIRKSIEHTSVKPDRMFKNSSNLASREQTQASAPATEQTIIFEGWARHRDYEKLEKILFNLISNAFKYTPDNGKVTISIPKNNELNHDEKEYENSLDIGDPIDSEFFEICIKDIRLNYRCP